MSNNSNNDTQLKIAVLGDTLVGKTSLTYTFINNKFPSSHETTIEDTYSIPAQIEGFTCRLEILDTAGQDDYKIMLDSWINSCEGFLLVYSIDNLESFDNTMTRLQRISKLKQNKEYFIIIIGNKSDLEERRVVSKDKVEKYCKGLKISFLETSALNNVNVKESFLIVARELLKQRFPLAFKDDKLNTKNKSKCFCF